MDRVNTKNTIVFWIIAPNTLKGLDTSTAKLPSWPTRFNGESVIKLFIFQSYIRAIPQYHLEVLWFQLLPNQVFPKAFGRQRYFFL